MNRTSGPWIITFPLFFHFFVMRLIEVIKHGCQLSLNVTVSVFLMFYLVVSELLEHEE